MEGYSKDLLFACMVTKKPICITDHVTGKKACGIVRSIDVEPGHPNNAILTINDQIVYHRMN